MDWNTEVGTSWYLERTDTRGMPSPAPRSRPRELPVRTRLAIPRGVCRRLGQVGHFSAHKESARRFACAERNQAPGPIHLRRYFPHATGSSRHHHADQGACTVPGHPSRRSLVQRPGLLPPPDEPHPLASATQQRRSLPAGAKCRGSRRRQLAGSSRSVH